MNNKKQATYLLLNFSFNIHIKFTIELYISILKFKLTDYEYNYIF